MIEIVPSVGRLFPLGPEGVCTFVDGSHRRAMGSDSRVHPRRRAAGNERSRWTAVAGPARRIQRGSLDSAYRSAVTDLPPRYPPYQTCHDRFQKWEREGVLDRFTARRQPGPVQCLPGDDRARVVRPGPSNGRLDVRRHQLRLGNVLASRITRTPISRPRMRSIAGLRPRPCSISPLHPSRSSDSGANWRMSNGHEASRAVAWPPSRDVLVALACRFGERAALE